LRKKNLPRGLGTAETSKSQSPKNPMPFQGELVAKREMFQGPLPHPSTLEAYNKIEPTASERIFNEFEENSAHIRETEKMMLNATVSEAKRGQWMAFVITIVLIALTSYLLYLDKNIAAFFSGLASAAILVKAFFANLNGSGK